MIGVGTVPGAAKLHCPCCLPQEPVSGGNRDGGVELIKRTFPTLLLLCALLLAGCISAPEAGPEGGGPVEQPGADHSGRGDARDGPGGGAANDPQLQRADINLVKYDGGYFSVLLPQGWAIQTMGRYTTFGFRAWNPQNPDYEIFSYGNLSPLLKSYEAKNNWAGYVNQGGYPNARLYADAPVINVHDAGSLFREFPALSVLAGKYVPDFSFPALQNFAAIETMPLQTPYASICTSEALVFAGLQGPGGTPCHGKFTASIWNTQGYFVGNVDMTPTAALNVTGVITPQADFADLQGVLTQAVFSLAFSRAYLKEATDYIQATGEAALADSAARQAVYDAANDAWDAYIRGD